MKKPFNKFFNSSVKKYFDVLVEIMANVKVFQKYYLNYPSKQCFAGFLQYSVSQFYIYSDLYRCPFGAQDFTPPLVIRIREGIYATTARPSYYEISPDAASKGLDSQNTRRSTTREVSSLVTKAHDLSKSNGILLAPLCRACINRAH